MRHGHLSAGVSIPCLQCTDFDALTSIIASLARANIDQRGNEVGHLPWAQEENEIIAKNIRSRRAWARVKPELTLFAVTDEEGVRLVDANDADPRLCRHWAEVFAARKDFPARQHFARLSTCDVLLPHLRWTMQRESFDEMLAAKR